jgi:glycosyl hydrolase family 113
MISLPAALKEEPYGTAGYRVRARSCASWRNRLGALLILAASIVVPASASPQRLDGFNVVAVPNHPFGDASTEHALIAARELGATTIAVIPFLWQASPSNPDLKTGTDMSDDALRVAIRQAHRLGLSVVVKPHIWVPESWAGDIEPDSEQSWTIWFRRYGAELKRIARVAADERAEALAIGTELTKTTQRSEWNQLIAMVRATFPGILFYIAHNVEEAEVVPFWPQLDVVGVSLYPPLSADDDRAGRLRVMREVAERLDALSVHLAKPVLIGEIGLRSASGAAARPWESAEERVSSVDLQLQADVLDDWLTVLSRPSIRGVLIWRWFTDPAAGGPADTDFTVQGKPAERVLACAWTGVCQKR